jgi:hypothetical protein
MKTMMLTKPLAAAIIAGCVTTFAVGVQFSPFEGSVAVAQRGAMQLNTGSGVETTGPFPGRDSRSSIEPVGEIRIPALPPQAATADGGPAIEVFDRKVRSTAEKQIALALAKSLNSRGMEYSDAPLEQVITEIANEYAVPILIDKPALEDAGLGPDEPVTIQLAGNMSLRSALRHILRQHHLSYIVEDEVMLITTPTEAEENMETRVYPVDDTKTAATLQKLILSHVRPESWIRMGGTANVSSYSGGVVVTQTYEAHEQIHDLLKQLGWPSRAK